MIYKKGISAVVATVLLILLTFTAIALVWGFILPMVKKSISEGATCFDLRDYAEIADSEYTCTSPTETKLVIERGMNNYTIKGFVVSILKGGSSQRYQITADNPDKIKMLNDEGESTESIELPGPGEARTYIFNIGHAEKAVLGVISENGKICELESYEDIPQC